MLHINSGSLITPSSGANGDEIRAEWRDHGQNVPNPSFTFYLRSFADVSTFSAPVDLQAGVIWSSEFLHGTLGGKLCHFGWRTSKECKTCHPIAGLCKFHRVFWLFSLRVKGGSNHAFQSSPEKSEYSTVVLEILYCLDIQVHIRLTWASIE